MKEETDIYIAKLIDKIYELKSNKDDEELYQCLYTIDNMIKGILPINKNVIESIQKKYEKEMEELSNIDKIISGFNYTKNSNEHISYYQHLRNVRHSLIRIGIKNSLKSLGYNILERDLVSKNETLYLKLLDILNNK